MARVVRTEVDVIDDLDGKPIPDGQAKQIEFAIRLPGTRKPREGILDLSPANYAKFEKDIGKYFEAATEVRNAIPRTATKSKSGGTTTKFNELDDLQKKNLREWAQDPKNIAAAGLEKPLSGRGRVPDSYVDAYEAAH